MAKKLLVIHGPNLHLLGKREPEVYGKNSLAEINQKIEKTAAKLDLKVDFFQSNQEGEIVDKITLTKFDLLIINPAAYTHTSIAIRDAIAAILAPVIEVHLSNIYKREEFRHKSLVSGVATGLISGFGKNSYCLAVKAAAVLLKSEKPK